VNANNATDIHSIFVPNSRSYIVAQHLVKSKLKVRVVGYDLIEKNKAFLKDGAIEFLIHQKAEEQEYVGINAIC